MDVANASMYEGASAFVEAVLMAERLTKKKTKVVVSAGIHPEYRQCLRTYLANFPFTIVEVPLGADGATDAAALAAAVDDATFAVARAVPERLRRRRELGGPPPTPRTRTARSRSAS